MPISLLVPSIVIGVTLVTLATWLAGGTKTADLDERMARERFLIDHPEATVRDVEVAADRRAALVWLGDECGVVFTVGDRFATRKLGPGQARADGEGLWLDFGDYGAPKRHVSVSTAWKERLGA